MLLKDVPFLSEHSHVFSHINLVMVLAQDQINPRHVSRPWGELELTLLCVKGVVGHVHCTLAQIDGLGKQCHISIVSDLIVTSNLCKEV